MRNPDRIPYILSLIEKGWSKIPDMRFGQLVENLKRYIGKDDIFYIEDDEIVNQIINYFDLNEKKKMVYFPFPIDCENCSKVTEIGVCEELDLLYAGKHPKYTKDQDWDFMCANCPHEVTEREYHESDEKRMGITVFPTKEEAEENMIKFKKTGE